MSSFEMVGEANIHVDSGSGMLDLVFLVQNDYWIFYPLDPHLLDLYIPHISLVLDINHIVSLYSAKESSFSQTLTPLRATGGFSLLYISVKRK